MAKLYAQKHYADNRKGGWSLVIVRKAVLRKGRPRHPSEIDLGIHTLTNISKIYYLYHLVGSSVVDVFIEPMSGERIDYFRVAKHKTCRYAGYIKRVFEELCAANSRTRWLEVSELESSLKS